MKGKKYLSFFLLVLLLTGGCTFQRGNAGEREQIRSMASTEETESQKAPECESERMQEETEYGRMELEEAKEPEVPAENTEEENIKELLNQMSVEEKAAQLFVILPEALVDGVYTVTRAGEMTKEAIGAFPVGGLIYMERNLQSAEQVKEMLGNVQAYSMERIGLPAFLCVDEEGGSVAKFSGEERFGIAGIESMAEIGQSQEIQKAAQIGNTIGAYLSELGFNVDFAPVADVLSNPENEVVKTRSFGSDPELVSHMAIAVAQGLEENGVFAVYKHFPGHGMTAGDTHAGYAYSDKTLEEAEACELVPFQKGIESGASFIMAGHISLPQITGEDTPSSLSEYMILDLLRGKMGYDGIVITDAMNMGAIVQQYSSAEAAVKAIAAGADLILMPKDFKEAYAGVIEAIQNGTLSIERIDESLERIIKVKLKMKGRDAQ